MVTMMRLIVHNLMVGKLMMNELCLVGELTLKKLRMMRNLNTRMDGLDTLTPVLKSVMDGSETQKKIKSIPFFLF